MVKNPPANAGDINYLKTKQRFEIRFKTDWKEKLANSPVLRPRCYSDLKTFEESSKSRNLLLLLACAHYPYFFLLLLLLFFLATP